jgi:hypothetical protein
LAETPFAWGRARVDNEVRPWDLAHAVRKLVWLVWLVASVLALPRSARADGNAEDVRDGLAARAEIPSDLAKARAAFERAKGSSDADTAAAGLYFLGEMDDAALDFAGAVAHFDASAARLPTGRYASRAATRKDQLQSHAEGDFGPLARLERLRRDPRLSNDPAAIEALVHAADDFPPGPVRVESRLLAAEALRGRLHRPDAALPLLWEVVRDPVADAVTAREAATEIVDSAIDVGDLDAASHASAQLDGARGAKVAARVARLIRRRTVHRSALGEIGLFFGLLTVALARRRARGTLAGTRRILPLAAAFCVFVAGGGGLLAASYEAGSSGPFLVLGPTMLAVILLSRLWSSVGSSNLAARVTRGTLSASSLFAAVFLLLERLTPQVLDGFGL